MGFGKAIGVAALVALSASSGARALEESSVPQQLLGLVGDWRLEQEDQTLPTCGLTFTEDESIGGWAIAFQEACLPPFPAVDRMVAWSVDAADGDILISDGAGNVVLRFEEVEGGLYVTPPDSLPTFYLMPPYDDGGTGGEIGEDVME